MKFPLAITCLILAACGVTERPAVKTDVAALVTSPERFAGKRVEIDAVLLLDFEVMVARDPIRVHSDDVWFDYAEYPAGENASRGFPQLKMAFERSRKEDASPMKMSARAQIVGVFQHSKQRSFGHLGAFRSQLLVEQVLAAAPFDEKPNKAPEPTPTSVTDRAAHAPRQP
jgi:hypothetical protein